MVCLPPLSFSCFRQNPLLWDSSILSDFTFKEAQQGRDSSTNRAEQCRMVYNDISEGQNPQVLEDLLRIVGEPSNSDWIPASPQDIASRLFHTVYRKSMIVFIHGE